MNDAAKSPSRANTDRTHYNKIAAHLSRKDQMPAQRPARCQKIKQTFILSGALVNTNTILEIGSGGGYASEYLKGRYQRYVGIDHSSENVSAATALHGAPGITFEVADISTYETEVKFDSVIFLSVLHHLEDPVHGLRRAASFVKSGGHILANEPQPGNPIITFARFIRKKVDRNYSEDQIEFSVSELEAMFKAANLFDVKITPQGFFSTPFSEVTFPFQTLMTPVAKFACWLDRIIEGLPGVSKWGRWLSWNLVVSGKVP